MKGNRCLQNLACKKKTEETYYLLSLQLQMGCFDYGLAVYFFQASDLRILARTRKRFLSFGAIDAAVEC